MSKRFTDTSIWERDWFLSLTPVEKAAWRYITDNCDNVGVWPCSFKKAEWCIGGEIDWNAFLDKCNDNIQEIGDSKWFLVDFCGFQYGELSEDCKPHRSYLSLLRKHGLEGYAKSILTLKEKEKEKELEKEKEPDKSEMAPGVKLTNAEYEKLVSKYGEKVAKQCVEKLSVAKKAKGYKYKSDYAAILNWVIGEVVKKGGVPAGKEDGFEWTCGSCGAKYRSTAATCARCGWERE